ncbi:hypothetical protein GCM10020254_58500 [Streptomyces goshikiensis]
MQLLGKTPTESGDEDRIGVDLTAVPEEVARIVVAASQYGGTRFGDLDGLRMTVADRSGEPLVGFSIDDASVETAFIFGELYRRGEEWKFRAVGQGYETGLAGLATDFGIAVEEAEEPEQPEAEAEPPEPGGAVAPRAAQTTTAGTPGPAGSPAAPQTARPESGTAGGPAAPGGRGTAGGDGGTRQPGRTAGGAGDGGSRQPRRARGAAAGPGRRRPRPGARAPDDAEEGDAAQGAREVARRERVLAPGPAVPSSRR